MGENNYKGNFVINYSITYFNFLEEHFHFWGNILTYSCGSYSLTWWIAVEGVFVFVQSLFEWTVLNEPKTTFLCLPHTSTWAPKCHHFDFNILHLLFSLQWPFTKIGLLKDVLRLHWTVTFSYSNLKSS